MQVVSKSKRSLRLTNDITSLYRWPFLRLIFSARCFRNCEASSAIPPVVLNTSGVNVAFSKFSTLHCTHIFCFSREIGTSVRCFCYCWTGLEGGVPLEYAMSSGDQNDLTLMSSLVPSCLLVPLDSLSVWGTERSWGSVSTSLQTVVRSSAILSLSELCLSET